MIVQYFPKKEIVFNNKQLEFGENRTSVRQKLAEDFEEDDCIYDFESSPEPIHQRRDIYENFDDNEVFFFLGYNKIDSLFEIEIYQCDSIKVIESSFDFSTELDDIVSSLKKYSDFTRLDEGEYFFKELHLVIASKQQMGSEGSTLGYFYCASDVSHLDYHPRCP